MRKIELEGLVRHYEYVISAMQEHVFYCEDEEGVLRRWYPPTLSPIGPAKSKEKSDE